MQEVHPLGGATLDDLGRAAEQRLARSVDNKKMATQDSREVHFVDFLELYNVKDVFARNSGDVLKCYAIYLLGGSTLNGQKVKVGTLKGYFDAVNNYYHRHGKAKPFNYGSKECKAAKLLRDQAKVEQMAERRLALMPKMTYKIIVEIPANKPFLGKAHCIANSTGFGRIAGSRPQEIVQDEEDEVRVYLQPDGTKIVRALTMDCVKCFDEDHAPVQDIMDKAERARVESMNILYPMQKNRENNQEIPHKRNREHPKYDICEHVFELADRAHALGQPNHMPLAVYLDETDNTVKYLTGKDVTEWFRSVAKVCMPGISAEDLRRYSAHSMRVSACVLLHEAGKDGTYIKLRLRWKSDCFEVYLRNTQVISAQHTDALAMAHEELEAMAVTE